MNKGQLVEAVAARVGSSKTEASRFLEAVIASIAAGIEQDGSVTISGFGTFTKKKRAARTVVNPSTHQLMEIKPFKTVSFRPSQALKETVNEGQP